jgi:hypothetical protein
MSKLYGPKLKYKGAGKGDKTVTRTNFKRWNKNKVLPERVVKVWPRDKDGNLI